MASIPSHFLAIAVGLWLAILSSPNQIDPEADTKCSTCTDTDGQSAQPPQLSRRVATSIREWRSKLSAKLQQQGEKGSDFSLEDGEAGRENAAPLDEDNFSSALTITDWFHSCQDLVAVIAKAVPARSYSEIDVRDPSISRWQLAMALNWAIKENQLLKKEISRLEEELSAAQHSFASATPTPPSNSSANICQHCWMPECKRTRAPVSDEACPDDNWERIPPDDDAGFEGEPSLAPRLDGRNVAGLDIRDKVKVHICHRTELQGTVLVSKLLHCDEHVPFSNDAWFRNAVRSAGPDHFELTLQGPEILPLHAGVQHRGACAYEMPFRVAVPGWYHVNMGFFRENYAGANELSDAWPPSHYDEPLGSGVLWLFGNGTTASAEELKTVQSEAGRGWCRLRPSVEQREGAEWYERLSLGRWVTTAEDGSDALWPAEMGRPPQLGSDERGFTLWPRVDLLSYTWQPYGCRLASFSPAEARGCLEGKSFFLRGDSHMRVVYNALVGYACSAPAQGSFGKSFCLQPTGQCAGGSWGATRICYTFDPTGEDLGCLDGREGQECGEGEVDAVTVVNFGQHFAAPVVSRNTSNVAYRAAVDRYVAALERLPAHKLRRGFLWMQTNAIPFTKDWWVRGNRDHRTVERLRVMNTYADSRMRGLGVGVIPTFNQTLPLGRLQHDAAHYSVAAMQQSVVVYLLGFLCPSHEEERE